MSVGPKMILKSFLVRSFVAPKKNPKKWIWDTGFSTIEHEDEGTDQEEESAEQKMREASCGLVGEMGIPSHHSGWCAIVSTGHVHHSSASFHRDIAREERRSFF